MSVNLLKSSYLSDIQYTCFYKLLGTRGIRLFEKQMCHKDPSECLFKKIFEKMLCTKNVYFDHLFTKCFLIPEKMQHDGKSKTGNLFRCKYKAL